MYFFLPGISRGVLNRQQLRTDLRHPVCLLRSEKPLPQACCPVIIAFRKNTEQLDYVQQPTLGKMDF